MYFDLNIFKQVKLYRGMNQLYGALEGAVSLFRKSRAYQLTMGLGLYAMAGCNTLAESDRIAQARDVLATLDLELDSAEYL